VKQFPRPLAECCQLCFEDIPARDHERHLVEFHKIAVKAVENKKPLQSWFGLAE
jgi:hypothetical protein